MNAISLLKQDHRNVEALFDRFAQTTDDAKRHDIVAKVIEHLSVHTAIEEEIFYPAVRRELPDLETMIMAGLEEHHVANWLLAELVKLPVGSPKIAAKMRVLRSNIEHHVNDEETTVFPVVLEALTLQHLNDIGAALEEAKMFAPTQPHPRSPDEPPLNIVINTAMAIVDRAVHTGRETVDRLLHPSH